MNTTEIQRIIREYYEKLYAGKPDNLEEMDNFLEKYNLPRLTKEETTSKQTNYQQRIESVIKKLAKNKKLSPDVLTNEFYQAFSEDLIPIHLKVFQTIEDEGILPNSFCEPSITLISKPGKDPTIKRKLQTNIRDEHRCKNTQ